MNGFEIDAGATLKSIAGRGLNTAGIKDHFLFTWFYFLSLFCSYYKIRSGDRIFFIFW